MLREKLSSLSESLVLPFPRNDYLPPCSDRIFWESLPPGVGKRLLSEGKDALKQELPVLKATHYREFFRNGNRTRYEEIYFTRRIHLFRLVKAYCVKSDEALMDGIIDDLDSLCGEWSWVLPAHNWPLDNPFPPADPPRVDLFAGNTASLAALAVHLLRDDLDREADRLAARVKKECRRRCITPYLKNNDHWWMGYIKNPNHGELNNWTPWITDNFLHTLFLIEDDREIITGGVKRAAEILSHYLDVLPEDGGCDEGPSYWDHAVGSLYDCLDILHWSCARKSSLLSDPFLNKAVSYIASLHLSKDYFVNFADCSGRLPHMPLGLMLRMGKELKNGRITALARQLERENGDNGGGYEESFSPQRRIRNLTINPQEPEKKDLQAPAHEVFSLLQTAVIRKKNYIFACKGGHNGESHNHNDVGQFIIFGKNAPLLVDPGVGDYTRETFSEERYSIWTMQSGWHNLPTINGRDQIQGTESRSRRFDFPDEHRGSVEIAGAYPPEAGLVSYTRNFRFTEKEIRMTDQWEFHNEPEEIIWNFLSLDEMVKNADYFVLTNRAEEKLSVKTERPDIHFSREYKSFPENNMKLRYWKRDGIWRNRFCLSENIPAKGKATFLFSVII